MAKRKFREFDGLDLVAAAREIAELWRAENTFELSRREGPPFVFYEGPPSANGMPGIHHVMSRTIKDLVCRYKTQRGYQVNRKAGWDTHGLPIELGVEKELGITKDDIGRSISVADYNQACRTAVMRYTSQWREVTEKMGYWVDLDKPYVTYENEYIESVWWLLQRLFDRQLLYKGFSIQPYSPAAGTGLSSHELNLPGCYKPVKDTTVVALFPVQLDSATGFQLPPETFIMAWTTTPWTLPSNTALCVGPDIDYSLVSSFNPYTGAPQNFVLATALVDRFFDRSAETHAYIPAQKNQPARVLSEMKGSALVGIRYRQLLPYAVPAPQGTPFQVIADGFVTTADGTGIVHIAPTFGADDMRAARAAGLPAMLVAGNRGELVPLVDLRGRFHESLATPDELPDLRGKFVKNEYYPEGTAPADSADVEIALALKRLGLAYRIEKYEHSYPHCWRTDKPVLYYPLNSWFIKTTALREKMVALNQQITWQPESTGTGRFGNWLENLNDWNLSRSRFWGTPLPIWVNGPYGPPLMECVGSIAEFEVKNAYYITESCTNEHGERHDGHSLRRWLGELRTTGQNVNSVWNELIRSRKVVSMATVPRADIDLHRPFVDYVVFFRNTQVLARELDLIDVWFDSGAMPFAQWHYPFEPGHAKPEDATNGELGIPFPADFIAEGVDQTRGWFFTLHAIAALTTGTVAYKSVISNGLVLDKNGQKMSKRLGNTVNPFETLDKYGPDATRWYLIANSPPWDNLKFDAEGIAEVQRKYFRALANTYSFFALYANLDGFVHAEPEAQFEVELDQWLLSRLESVRQTVETAYDNLDPTTATRCIQEFVVEELSNWYVRLCRRRFWKGEYTADKVAAYQCLYTALSTIAKLSAPVAPFYSDLLYRCLNNASGLEPQPSVHLAPWPAAQPSRLKPALEQRMELARRAVSLALALRKKEGIKVRQPLAVLRIPVLDAEVSDALRQMSALIAHEVNVKEVALVSESSLIEKSIKPNFKVLGKKAGGLMKAVAQAIAALETTQIAQFESTGKMVVELASGSFELALTDVEITAKEVAGWATATDGELTVALDVNITPALQAEGMARELVNRIQNLRKDTGLNVIDRIEIQLHTTVETWSILDLNKNYICAETLATRIVQSQPINETEWVEAELDNGHTALIHIEKLPNL